ncbi:MAG: helix-turn-helix domain-containing protein [Bdellovibrionales bacterium]|nr:helix-turn-helix domain-containing protein [Bdellovibrionales bacterium]
MPKTQMYALKPAAIANLIEAQQLKRWWVAELSGVHKTTLRRWLRGRIARASAVHIRRLAAVLQTQVQEIGEPAS